VSVISQHLAVLRSDRRRGARSGIVRKRPEAFADALDLGKIPKVRGIEDDAGINLEPSDYVGNEEFLGVLNETSTLFELSANPSSRSLKPSPSMPHLVLRGSCQRSPILIAPHPVHHQTRALMMIGVCVTQPLRRSSGFSASCASMLALRRLVESQGVMLGSPQE
jgi:hypothetical protein